MKKKRSFSENLLLMAKGLAMGAADVVPGVSGGTIAFITGIYEELLDSISRVNAAALRTLRYDGFKAFWNHINGTFFAYLLTGIVVSIVSLAHLIQFLLNDYPIPTWSFFFGLILASVAVVFKSIKSPREWSVWTALILGVVVAFFITLATPATGTDNLIYLFFCGSIAIMAMILPGISGSFILLLLGVYLTVMETISAFVASLSVADTEILFSTGITLLVFIAGCVTGLLLFARLLKWMFNRAHDLTVAVLTGFLIGSLNKVWPWKKVVSTFVKHEGTEKEKIVPLVERNISPLTYSDFTGEPSFLMAAVVAATIGFFIVFILHKLSPEQSK